MVRVIEGLKAFAVVGAAGVVCYKFIKSKKTKLEAEYNGMKFKAEFES